jgi:hypothetical protein
MAFMGLSKGTTNTINKISSLYGFGKTIWKVYKTITTPSPSLSVPNIPYRPSEWNNYPSGDAKSPELIEFAPNISEVVKKKTSTLIGVGAEWGAEVAVEEEVEETVGYFFDAFLKEDHSATCRITDHPVMDGTNISDHAYNLPDKLVLEIMSSDIMDQVVANQFSDYTTKSISVYAKLKELKEQRMPLSVNTRLEYYENMLIESMTTIDTFQTRESVKCTVILKEIIMAKVEIQKLSAAPQKTEETNKGEIQSKPAKDPVKAAEFQELLRRRKARANELYSPQ